MELRSRLFLMMRCSDASQASIPWFMVGAATPGRLMLRPRADAGWLALTAFGVGWILVSGAIWLWGFRSGLFSAEFAVLATVLVAGIVAACFIRLLCARMARLPPSKNHTR
jgi:hypothetical protein